VFVEYFAHSARRCTSSSKRYEAFAAGTLKTPYPPSVESPTNCPSAYSLPFAVLSVPSMYP
jgi:hypothetical protein